MLSHWWTGDGATEPVALPDGALELSEWSAWCGSWTVGGDQPGRGHPRIGLYAPRTIVHTSDHS